MSEYTPEQLREVASTKGGTYNTEWADRRLREYASALEELAALRAQLAERDAEIKALKAHAREMRRRIEGIANWRVEAHKYDADMDNEPRTFCEDVELIEQAAQDALAAFPKED